MTRRVRSKGEATRAGVEDQLLVAVERLVGKGASFTSLSVEELAAAAGVSRATFYLHFRDKGYLVSRLMGRVMEEILAATGDWFKAAETMGRPEFQQAIRGFLGVLKRHEAVLTAVSETSLYDPEVKRRLEAMLGDLRAQSRKAIGRLREAGKAHPGASTQVVDVLAWAVYAIGLHFIRDPGGVKIAQLAEALEHICWNATFADR